MDETFRSTPTALPARSETVHPLPETVEEAEKLAASIEQAVWRETAGRVRNLRVEVNGDGVLLTGQCHTYYAKQQAQHAAMRLPCQGTVTNQIEVG